MKPNKIAMLSIGLALLGLALFLSCRVSAAAEYGQEYMNFPGQHKEKLGDSGKISEWLFKPAMSSKEFTTFDGNTTFQAALTCSSESPVVKVSAFPVGNLATVGELNIRMEYDATLSGSPTGSLTINNIAGICGNGYIKNCNPSGSWQNCRFCQWELDGGVLKERCDYGAGDTQAPIGPQGMKGCFCFNASCGAPVLSMMETILSFAATGVLNLLREQNPLLAVTKSEYSSSSMELSYMGAKVSNCTDTAANAEVTGLTGLYGQWNFPVDDALEKAKADPGHPYNILESTFQEDTSVYSRCVIESQVGVEARMMERKVTLDFGVGVDANGSSKQCYVFRGGSCGTVFGETKYLDVCIGRIVPGALGDICNQHLVNSGTLQTITGVSEYRATSGVGNFIGCYGSEDDSADQYWEVKCHGLKMDDYFICKSAGMGISGQTIANSSDALYQGCNEIRPPASSCDALEQRRRAGECQIHSELTDGVYTVRGGANTGLVPAESCKSFQGSLRSLTVCEPWWRKDRVYRCLGEDPDFSRAKERAWHIGNTINFDTASNTWQNQGDLAWDKNGVAVSRVYDPNIEFTPSGDCIPACRVEKPAKVTDIYIPAQGKLAADGSYHMEHEGQLSYTVNRDTVLQAVKECSLQKDNSYSCPLESDEILVTDCTCFDAGAFGQVVSSLSAISLASQNMICSTGKTVGICSAEDLGESDDKVVCGDFTYIDGQLRPNGDITECKPKLWRGTKAADQSHRIVINDDLRCMASAGSNTMDLGQLIPDAAWFEQGLSLAKAYILDTLMVRSDYVPSPESGCECSGASCSWTNLTGENNLSAEQDFTIAPGSNAPFGSIRLTVTQKGYWSQGSAQCGTHNRNHAFQVRLTIDSGNAISQLVSGTGQVLRQWAFTQSYLIQRQCVERYSSAFADFTDPLTNYPFKVSHFDEMAYALAADQGELPRADGGLPLYPPVYRPLYSHGGNSSSSIPNRPMFWDAALVPAYGEQFGEPVTLTATNLTPYVYYYQCPLSNPVASNNAASCGAVAPTGGVDATILGNHCFKHRCDAQAITEPGESFSGCGMVNDAEWQ